MAIKRSWDDDRDVENFAMANCLMLLSRVGESGIPGRVFHCKTCNKEFQSFQALGGHRASHKRPRSTVEMPPAKPKTHECSICGQEFGLGQALGGHMRRHRDSVGGKDGRTAVVPVMEKMEKGERGLCLDLNLTPYENDVMAWRSRGIAAVAI